MTQGRESKLFWTIFYGSFFASICVFLYAPTFAKQMIVYKSVMNECAFERDFTQCCFSKADIIDDSKTENQNTTPTSDNNQQNENQQTLSSNNYTPNTLPYVQDLNETKKLDTTIIPTPNNNQLQTLSTNKQTLNTLPYVQDLNETKQTDIKTITKSNNNQQKESLQPQSQDNYTPKTLHYGGASIDNYNKYFPQNRPLFDYYESHLIKKCEDVGHWYQSPNHPDYKECICDNGGNFDGTDCFCYGWTENGKCSCPIGTTKYVFQTGPEENIDVVNCRNSEHINDWTFSQPEDWNQRPYFRNDLNNENADDEFWKSLTSEQQNLLITHPRLPGYEELSAYRKTLIRDDIWKAWGIKAKKGIKTVTFDVVGTSKCIDTFANLDARGGSECVCSILSVSKGVTPKFWAYNPLAHFYVGFYADMTEAEICESECAKKCGQAFAKDEYNLRHILLNWWSPN